MPPGGENGFVPDFFARGPDNGNLDRVVEWSSCARIESAGMIPPLLEKNGVGEKRIVVP
jgi:hypothetical protein